MKEKEARVRCAQIITRAKCQDSESHRTLASGLQFPDGGSGLMGAPSRKKLQLVFSKSVGNAWDMI